MARRTPIPIEMLLNGDPSNPTRRKILSAMGMAGAAGVAGCLGDDEGGDDAGDDTGDSDSDDGDPAVNPVEDQELVLSTAVNPAQATFQNIGPGFSPAQFGEGALTTPDNLYELMMDHGMWGHWSNITTQVGEAWPLLFDDWDISADEITVQLRDDAVWSDGEPMKGRDFITVLAAFRMWPNVKPPSNVIESGPGQIEGEPITDFEWDDSSFTLISEGGYFADEMEQDIYREMLTRWRNWAGVHHPTHVEPYTIYRDRIWETWEDLKAGEIEHIINGGELHIVLIQWDAFDFDEDWPAHLQDPENVVTCGAWQLAEIRGTESIILEPNPHHRNADDINFDRIVVEHRAEDRANWASMQANRLDYFQGFVPDDVIDNLPGTYDYRPAPTDDGIGFALDHSTPFFEDVRARQAFMYLLDTEAIVSTESRGLFEPVFIPGGDAWGAEEFLDDEFVEDTLNRYGHDPQRAAELFEEAGWTKEGDDWYLPNGERARIEIPTTERTPRWQVSVEDQLNAFGIEASVRIRSGEANQESFENYEDDWWHDPGKPFVPGMGHIFPSLTKRFAQIIAHGWWNQAHNIFPEAQIEQTDYPPHEDPKKAYGFIRNTTPDPEGFGGFTIEAPEVGDWDGPTKEWEAPGKAWVAFGTGDRELVRDSLKELAWIVNWSLPGLPLAHARSPMTVNDSNWVIPATDSEEWAPVGQDRVLFEHLIGMGDKVFANSDNPK